MRKRFVLLIVATAALLVLFGYLAGAELLGAGDKAMRELASPGLEEPAESAGGQKGAAALGIPVPGHEDVPEMIVGGEEDAGAVSSGMPVPGLGEVPEMVVVEE
jgi:hypothetical protein